MLAKKAHNNKRQVMILKASPTVQLPYFDNKDRKTVRLTDGQTDRQADRQTDRQTMGAAHLMPKLIKVH